jgi:multidrug efflux pump subunit AcrA (membrane-fusion protein)
MEKFMKTKLIFVVVILVAGAGTFWLLKQHPTIAGANMTNSDGRKVLYYTCAMHPWVHESKPGQCPVCGMNLTPVYENGKNASATNSIAAAGEVTLESESISAINVQTDQVERRPVRHTLHVTGQIVGNSSTVAWFEFTAYERDLPWLKAGQTFNVIVPSAAGEIYQAQIKLHGIKPFADTDFDMMTGSTKMRAEIANAPVLTDGFGKDKLFNNLHAEAHLAGETEAVLAIPRSAIISRGFGAMVYVDKGDGHYAPRAVELGRVGDEFTEVLGGLAEGEKVVTNGNVLIDSEAQLVNEQ